MKSFAWLIRIVLVLRTLFIDPDLAITCLILPLIPFQTAICISLPAAKALASLGKANNLYVALFSL